VNILKKFRIHPVTAVAVVVIGVATALSGACASDTTSAQAPPAAVTGATSLPSPSLTSTPTESADPEIAPTDPPAPAVTEVKAELIPEVGQVDSLEHTSTGTTKCASGYTTERLTLNGTVTVDEATVKTTVTEDTAVIEAEGKLLSVKSLVVNGTKGTPLTPDVAQATHTRLTFLVRKWTKNVISSLAFCLGGSGLRAPVLPD
jgi:hypothetical protein